MNPFNLPKRTEFNRVIPKNAFDKYTNTSQKNMLSSDVHRIRWTHKLAAETINLAGHDLEEIQVFEVELREDKRFQSILKIIDKAIPYTIIFVVLHGDQVLISVSKKHPHPTNENNAVIDWTFTSDWGKQTDFAYKLDLSESLDHILTDLCNQISPLEQSDNLETLVESQLQRDKLLKAIKRTKQALKSAKQFNIKVELNQQLQKFRDQLKKIESGSKKE